LNKLNYFKEISKSYNLNDFTKINKTLDQIDFFISNLSTPLRFFFSIYFIILQIFPLSLFSQSIVNFLPKIIGLRLFHELCVNIFLLVYYDDI
jgi:hypothetical protein